MVCRVKVAWQEEFWPTTAAEFVVHLLWTLCNRGLWLYDPDLRRAYVSAVPKVTCMFLTRHMCLTRPGLCICCSQGDFQDPYGFQQQLHKVPVML